jgi:CRP-like cAMP-binding protein
MNDTLQSLPPSSLLAPLPPEAQQRLAMHGAFHEIQPGEVLIKQGVSHGSLFYIISGEFEAKRDDQDNTILLGRIHAGEWVGEVDLFDEDSAVCSVIATTPGKYWVIQRREFDAFNSDFPADGNLLLNSLALLLSHRIRNVTRKLAWRSLIS